MDSNQRPRTEFSKAWLDASTYIERRGGFISKSLQFSDSTRTVHLIKNIQKGDLLMRIPQLSLITLKSVEKSSLGTSLFKLVHLLDDEKLFHEKNDLLLALFLAFVSLSKDDKNANAEFVSEHDAVLKYLTTLPASDSYDNLPRRWSDTKLNDLLGGTTAFDRAKDEKSGLDNDYKILKDVHCNLIKSGDISENRAVLSSFPTIERFDQMLSAVGSRAFESLGEAGIDAMIPLLDLFNHKRGVGETSDVSYKREEDGSIHVIAKRTLDSGSVPGITYGAKGNSQLLMRYGFTLERNIEPDGSSNDAMEFRVKGKSITLRTGPKSYTYGCFVKAIEAFRDQEDDDQCVYQNESSNEFGGMEDFLNSCEEDEEDFYMYGDEGADRNVDWDEGDGTDQDEKKSDCRAIESFRKALQDAESAYTLGGKNFEKALNSSSFSSERFCAYLLMSEIRTIRFYLQAADLIQSKLQETAAGEVSFGHCNEEDTELLRNQAIQLRDVFCTLRYPNLV